MGRRPHGQYLHSNGYVLISGGRHAQYEHRVIAERVLGRPLKRTDLVHHINGDKTDNRWENLKVLDHTVHNHLHLGKKVEVTCGYCGKPLLVWPSKLALSKSGQVFCGNHCRGLKFNGTGLRGRPFTHEEDEAIKRMYGAGIGPREAGRRLGHNHESIRTRAKRLGVL